MYEFFQSLGQNIVDGIKVYFTWLANIFVDLWEGFKNFIAEIFRNFILFFQGIWYLLEKCFDIVVLTVQVIFGLFKVIYYIITGIFTTFSELLGFSGSSDYYYLPGSYQHGYDVVAGFFSQTGLSTIAIILIAFIWMATAYAVIKIAGSR